MQDGKVKPNITFGDVYLLSHVKKYRGRFIHEDKNGNTVNSMVTFYQEREWRYVPEGLTIDNIRIGKEDGKKIEADGIVSYSLSFNPNDIRYLIVEDEGKRADLIKLINERLNFEHERDKEILKSRILTVTQIKEDF